MRPNSFYGRGLTVFFAGNSGTWKVPWLPESSIADLAQGEIR